ncbi:hypothetical protein NA78x_000646 [Anatilimnocola sp. NA78]|uniref:hypothetical protein n=1 Tax=Anatilimnocola sp. NA78 TaxID=3415683 RepID=UPI003CE46EBA
MKFTIRDLLWLALTTGLAIGWWLDHRLQTTAQQKAAQQLLKLNLALDAEGIAYRDQAGQVEVYATHEALAAYGRSAKLATLKLVMLESRLAEEGRTVVWSTVDGNPVIKVNEPTTVDKSQAVPVSPASN